MAFTFSSAYVGDALERILASMILGNEAVEKGSVNVIEDVQKTLFLPRIEADLDALQDAVPEPVTDADAYTYNERSLTPLDAMWYDRFNPRTFEDAWRPFQPSGPLVDKVSDPDILAAIVERTSASVGNQVGSLIWAGDVGAGGGSPLRFFDGYFTTADADGATVKVATPVALTVGNILAELDRIDDAIPDSIYDDDAVVYHMSTKDFRKYSAALRALGTDFGNRVVDATELRFAGREIRHYSRLPENRVMVAKATAGMESNLHLGCNLESDWDNIKVERHRPESELFFVKVLFKTAVNYGISEEIVVY